MAQDAPEPPPGLEPSEQTAQAIVAVLCEELGEGEEALLGDFLLHARGRVGHDDDVTEG